MPDSSPSDSSPSRASTSKPEAAAAPPGARTVKAERAAGPRKLGTDGFNPYAKLFRQDGSIDQEYGTKRIPALIDLLRNHHASYELRLDPDGLAERMRHADAQPMRDATSEEDFDAQLGIFSRANLHELVDNDLGDAARAALEALTADVELSRRQRVAAALGVTLLSGAPDKKGLRGRALLDLIFRVSLEEVHAQDQLRLKARESEDGLSVADLQEFWSAYPALRHRYEQRYRRELQRVVEAIEAGDFPQAVSVDLALRGAAQLLAAVHAARAKGELIDVDAAQEILRDPYEHDMLDGGREVVLARWAAAAADVSGATSGERREFVRLVETAIRLVSEGGPAADLLVFYSYLRALVDGHFYVRDEQEADAARGMFHDDGLSCEAVLNFIAFHRGETGDPGTRKRLVLAATELWPDDERVRAEAEQLGEAEMAAAQASPQGPILDEDGTDADDAGLADDEGAGDLEPTA